MVGESRYLPANHPGLAEWGYVALLHGWKIRGDDPPDAPIYDDLEGGSLLTHEVIA